MDTTDKKIEIQPTQSGKKPVIKNKNALIILVISLLAAIVVITASIAPKKPIVTADFSAVSKICELATLKCYYHNVAEYEKQPDGLFQYGFFQYGYKKFWIEYEGIVEAGINVSKVQVNQPDKNGVVRIYVPNATILTVNVNESSMSDPIVDTGIFTKITSAEQSNAFSEAQKSMRANAEADENILNKAHNNAKDLLAQYVINVGKQIEQVYTVEWLESPK